MSAILRLISTSTQQQDFQAVTSLFFYVSKSIFSRDLIFLNQERKSSVLDVASNIYFCVSTIFNLILRIPNNSLETLLIDSKNIYCHAQPNIVKQWKDHFFLRQEIDNPLAKNLCNRLSVTACIPHVGEKWKKHVVLTPGKNRGKDVSLTFDMLPLTFDLRQTYIHTNAFPFFS
jgi:hypothetical protein